MASATARSEARRERKHEKAGARRKKRLSKKSTLSTVELFAGLGEPGKAAPSAKAKKA